MLPFFEVLMAGGAGRDNWFAWLRGGGTKPSGGTGAPEDDAANAAAKAAPGNN